MVLSALAFTLMGTLIKRSGQDLHTFQIAFFRCLFGVLILAPFVLRTGLGVLKTERPVFHMMRIGFGLSAMYCLFYSMTALPLATAVSISFARPLFMLLLAILFLGETVGWRRSMATGVGFLGVLVVMRPDPNHMEWAMLAPLSAAFLVATAMTMVKIISRDDPPLTILSWFAISSTFISLVPAIAVWQWPEPWLLAVLVLVGGFGSLGQYLAVKAFSSGEASVVGPFEFTQILFAAVFGFAFFGEVPDIWTGVGAMVIAASALYILLRESRLKKAAT